MRCIRCADTGLPMHLYRKRVTKSWGIANVKIGIVANRGIGYFSHKHIVCL